VPPVLSPLTGPLTLLQVLWLVHRGEVTLTTLLTATLVQSALVLALTCWLCLIRIPRRLAKMAAPAAAIN
jgi:hypothetical protein